MSDVNKQLLERWAAFGKAMQKSGSELPRHLIADTEKAIAAAEQGQPEPRCACGDSFTSDAVCANCLAAPQQAELVTKTDTSLITAADAALRYIAAMHSAEVPLEPFSAAVTAQALASALHPHKTPVGREADSKMVMAISTTQQQSEPVAWKHDCAALLMNDVELWVRNCPHCGKPCAAQPPAVAVPEIKEAIHGA